MSHMGPCVVYIHVVEEVRPFQGAQLVNARGLMYILCHIWDHVLYTYMQLRKLGHSRGLSQLMGMVHKRTHGVELYRDCTDQQEDPCLQLTQKLNLIAIIPEIYYILKALQDLLKSNQNNNCCVSSIRKSAMITEYWTPQSNRRDTFFLTITITLKHVILTIMYYYYPCLIETEVTLLLNPVFRVNHKHLFQERCSLIKNLC